MSGKHGTSAERRIAVIGAGSWGTALVKLLTGSQESVGWWVRRQATIDHIVKYGHNPDYTSGAQLDASRLSMGTDIRAVVKGADVVVLAVPSAFLKAAMDQLEPDALKGKTCLQRRQKLLRVIYPIASVILRWPCAWLGYPLR